MLRTKWTRVKTEDLRSGASVQNLDNFHRSRKGKVIKKHQVVHLAWVEIYLVGKPMLRVLSSSSLKAKKTKRSLRFQMKNRAELSSPCFKLLEKYIRRENGIKLKLLVWHIKVQ